MSEQPPTPPDQPTPSATTNVSGGANLQTDGDIVVSGDVVGRDKITTHTTNVTHVGMTPEAVRRLVITVGVLVFVTAFCFFTTGAVAGAAALSAFQRELPSNQAAAEDFQNGLQTIQAAPAGVPFQWSFEENDLSSYMRFILGPQMGLGDTGRARFMPSQQIAFRGNWSQLSGLPVMAVTTIQTNAQPVYRLDSSFVQILPLGENLGWVPVPNGMLQPFVDWINADIGAGYVAQQVQYPSFAERNGQQWPVGDLTIGGVTQ
jgi:hypothetical protein